MHGNIGRTWVVNISRTWVVNMRAAFDRSPHGAPNRFFQIPADFGAFCASDRSVFSAKSETQDAPRRSFACFICRLRNLI
jgi:hypothetical protein